MWPARILFVKPVKIPWTPVILVKLALIFQITNVSILARMAFIKIQLLDFVKPAILIVIPALEILQANV